MYEEPARRASDWLDRTYSGTVALAEPEPFAEGARNWLFNCAYAGELADEPMLTATIAVPKDGGAPYPVANAAPLDESVNAGQPGEADTWRWRVNARNCLVATDAAVDRRQSVALPWRPEDERPGWWDRLLAAHFPGAEVSVCRNWAQVASLVADGGPGTRAVVWLRRQLSGVEITGHLLYASHFEGGAVVLDGQRGTLAELDDAEVGELVVASFHRPEPSDVDELIVPWEQPADTLDEAVEKANRWLADTYGGEVVLVDPDPADETGRGWLFACTTTTFQETGDWHHQMLDAALVVPKARGTAPFGLPNSDPWNWLLDWEAGTVEQSGPPQPAAAAWFESTMREVGPVRGESAHDNWAATLGELSELPVGARALVWVRRTDRRGRETVGNLLLADNRTDGLRLIDSLAAGGQPRLDPDVLGVHVFLLT